MKTTLTENNVIEVVAEACDPWIGKTYGHEVIDHPEAGRCLQCGTVKFGRKKHRFMLKLSDKPELAAMVDEMVAAREAKEAAKEAAEKAHRDGIDNSTKPITIRYCDGEYLTGYEVVGYEAEKLSALGLATYVDSWGYHVATETVEALGKSFTLAEAIAYAQPALDAAAEKKLVKEKKAAEHLAECIAEAKTTGKKVVVAHWMEDCDRSVDECDLDAVTQWIDADGNLTTTRCHTH